MSMQVFPIILSGGAGTRLWPVSRNLYPKQLLPMTSDKSMLQETALRLHGIDPVAPPIVVCNEEHRFVVSEQLRTIGVDPTDLILESVGRNTAPAIAAAAEIAARRDPEAVILALPADHYIRDLDAFRGYVSGAISLAAQGHMVAFGIIPDRPHTGYGYIRKGAAVGDDGAAFRIDRFVEKPDQDAAKGYIEEGEYLWNGGIYAFRCDVYLRELEKYHPEIGEHVGRAVRAGVTDLDFFRLGAAELARCPAISVDYAVMERTEKGIVIPADMGWSDVGSWDALYELEGKDADGNVLQGDVLVKDTANSYIRSESALVGAVGVRDLAIVQTADAVLVAHRDSAQEVRSLVEDLRADGRMEHETHVRVWRPWGYYESLDVGDRFQVKHLMVRPGAALSLQLHHHRAEHWVVVAGTARVTRGDEVMLLSENESTYISIGTPHRLENPGMVPLELIEVQSGGYLGEDDIVRLEDIYNRQTT